jgi:PAS domain S-box-containing protein
MMRKLVRIRNANRITSIADLVSARYNRSQTLAAMVTTIAGIGVTPYVALQFRAIESTFGMLTGSGTGHEAEAVFSTGPIVAALLVLFTVAMGIRRLDATERHPGMVAALAVESFVKLAAFLAVGVFVTYFLFDGLSDIFRQQASSPVPEIRNLGRLDDVSPFKWGSFLVLSASAIMFLPRQFHIAVVENLDENHLKTAVWLFPLYMFLISLFVLPIAVAGLLKGYPVSDADTLVLGLPLAAGNTWLSLFVFIGGFSAGTAMIMATSVTMATMATNHLLLPVIGWIKPLGFLRRRLLICRWLAAAAFIGVGFLTERYVGHPHMLANIGIISFAAVLQFAPPILGGLFWRRGSETGAVMGLAGGFTVWAYTLLLPALIRSGWLTHSILVSGPLGIQWLHPEQLFGTVAVDPVTHTVFWSLFFNIGLYVVGSVYFGQSAEEQRNADHFVGILSEGPKTAPAVHRGSDIDLGAKLDLVKNVLAQYFSDKKVAETVAGCLTSVGLRGRARISISELAELQGAVETKLSGYIGSAEAHKAFTGIPIFTPEEERALSEVYAGILADLKVTPAELKRKADYYQEREKLFESHSRALREKIREREEEIRQRKIAEEKLAKAEEKYRSIFENAVEGIFQTTPEGGFLSVNRALARMLGYESTDGVIKSIHDIGKQLYVRVQDRHEFMRRLEERGSVSGFECEFRRKGGSTVWASVTARLVRDDAGRTKYVEGTFQDITARKQAEAEREELEEQLRQSQKMEAIGRLAGGVAHDFNNLLTAMMGYANILAEELPPGSPEQEKVLQINRAAERAASLTQQLLAFGRKQVLNVRVMDVNELIIDLESMLRRLIGEHIELKTVLDENVGRVKADAGQIEQIVMNLAVNARDAMPQGGNVVIRTDDTRLDERRARMLEDMDAGRYVLVTVSDNGVGMSPSTADRIFDPFFTTKEKDEGTGLGLATVYGIVKQHHGHISVETGPGRGTTFKVLLPCTDDDAEDPSGLRETSAPGTVGGETVLVVEDEEIVLDLASELLEALGYKTLKAADPETAQTVCAEYPGAIDVMLTDVVLPRMDGRALFRKVSPGRPSMKVLYMSGYTDEAIVRHGVLDPDVRFLPKPFTLQTLAAKIRRVLDEDRD